MDKPVKAPGGGIALSTCFWEALYPHYNGKWEIPLYIS